MTWDDTIPDPLRGASILIVDDCMLYRENLAANFEPNLKADLHIAWDLPSLVSVLQETEPHIILLNISARDSALLLRAAMDLSPGARIIVLGASDDNEAEVIACAEAGVAGYHMRSDSLEDLLGLMRHVAGGNTSCPPEVAAMLLRRVTALSARREPPGRELAPLTTRENQVLAMLELGRSNQDIAAHLSIAVHTVKNHVHSVLTKLGVRTRAEAAAVSRASRLQV